MAESPAKQKVPYQDLPGIGHIFADTVQQLTFTGQVAHVTLAVTRHEDPQQAGSAQAKRYTAARLVLTPQLVLALHNELTKVVEAIDSEEAAKRPTRGSSTVQ